MKPSNPRPSRAWLLPLCALLLLPLACKDEAPCDNNQDSIGTGCFLKKEVPDEGDGGSGGVASAAGGEAGAGLDIAPPGNPDAMFGSKCEKADNSECGGPAPVCATEILFYCTELYCRPGEKNEGVCPAGWLCIKQEGSPSACVNTQ